MTDSINYAAPELMGMFKRETTQTDVYAYGRLYYMVFFDAMPFEGKKPSQILELISSGIRPYRPDSPRMDDDIWKLVEDCWSPDPSRRPTMEQIVASHMLMPRPMPRPMSRPESLITSLMAELNALSGPMANKHTIDHMRKLLALSDLESDNIISQLVPSDVELLLNFILQGGDQSNHPSILPLEGLFKHDSELYLVSRFATNGTLCDWRRNQIPAVVDILKRLLEVAEGVQYIHSEGIVHGNLHTRNILLDDDSHCRIADFGTSRRSEASETQPAIMFALRFGAPELFGMCTTCGFYGCDYHKERNNHKTMETDDKTKTDVYAFGCLYYAIFFNTIPFYDIDDFQNVLPITGGKRPARLQRPEMNDMTWKLLQSCWKSIPSERPTMAEIVETLRPKL
ncbi:kinase-like domain-containing protein [Amanita rubescens]|nr:kinase-like domain-containing protein [Amanita rubescens]